MSLHSGVSAPGFKERDINGNIVDLAAFQGRPLLLSFFRAASCPLCNLRVWYYQSQATKWQDLGLQVITVFDSSVDTTMAYCSGFATTFPLIADPHGTLFRRYRVGQSPWGSLIGLLKEVQTFPLSRRLHLPTKPYLGRGMFRMPADFLIDRSSQIAEAHYGRDAADHIDLDQVEQFARLQGLPITQPRPRV